MFRNLQIYLFLICISFKGLFAQSHNINTDSLPQLKISQLTRFVTLNQYALVYVDSNCTAGFKNIASSQFRDDTTGYFENTIPLKDTKFPYYFSFNVLNDKKDTASLFVYSDPQHTTKLCSVTDQGVAMNCYELQSDNRYLIKQEFFSVMLLPGQIQRYVVRIEFPQNRSSYLDFWIGPSVQFSDFVWYHFGFTTQGTLSDAVFLGMIAMMFLYMIAKYIQIRKLEYLYYALYTFCFLSFFVIKMMEMLYDPAFYSSPILYSLGYRLSQLLAYWMYYLFIQEFLSTKTVFPRAHKLINIVIGIIISFAVLDVVIFFIPSAYVVRWQLWDVARIVLALTGLAFTISFIFVGNVLSRYLVAGGTALAFFGMLSMLFSAYPQWIQDWPEFFNNGLAYFEFGILFELLFFALGLGHKNRMDEIEKVEAKEALKLTEERQHVKHLHALSEVQERERSRFAKDLHDGLGGMLWGIKLSLSNMKGNMILSNDQIPVFERSLDMLDNSIHELRRVAHNLMPEALVKFGLSEAVKDFCDFINNASDMNVVFQQVGDVYRFEASAEVIIYRLINELSNNAMRHSVASELIIQLHYEEHQITLTVEDNGVGFDRALLDNTTGSGWPNIKSRVEYLKGSLDIQTAPNKGTAINIAVPITTL